MQHDEDPRADALGFIARLDARLTDHAARASELAAEAAALREELAAVRAGVEAIEIAPAAAPAPAPAVPAAEPDLAGARIVALDLVLRGVARDEAVLRVAAEFPGVDAAGLVDEAATAQG